MWCYAHMDGSCPNRQPISLCFKQGMQLAEAVLSCSSGLVQFSVCIRVALSSVEDSLVNEASVRMSRSTEPIAGGVLPQEMLARSKFADSFVINSLL